MPPARTFTTEWLRSFRSKTDPEADAVIESLASSDIAKINELFEQLTRNRGIHNVNFSPEVHAYFEKNSVMPEWADHKKLHLGQTVYAELGLEVSMLLFFLSLPATYTGYRGATVLTQTGRMLEDPGADKLPADADGKTKRLNRRLMETAQFVVDVMAPESFHEKGSAIIAALKVRLMHAAIRRMIRESGRWDTETLGEPINQEDMAGTLMSFSALIIQGMVNMKTKLTKEEIDAYYHCWHVTGHFMGVDPELNFAEYEDGLALGHAIIHDQKGSIKGEWSTNLLMKALIQYVNEQLPGKVFDDYVPVFVIKYFLQNNVHETIDFHLKPNLKYYILEFLIKLFAFWENLQKSFHQFFANKHFKVLQNHIMTEMLEHKNDHKKIQFEIPASLRKGWTELKNKL